MQIDPKIWEERQFADGFSLNLPQDAQQRWSTCRSAHRFMAFQSKQLVAYRLLFSEPQVHSVLTCVGLSADIKRGLASVWTDGDGKEFHVSHAPVEVAPSCFLWHVKHSGLDYVQYNGEWNMKFSLAYRTRFNPTMMQDGSFYLLEKAVFDSFPWNNE